MIFLAQGVMVYVVNNGRQIVSGRSGDDDVLGTGIDMSLSLRLGGVETGALENDVNTQFSPRKVLSLGFRINGDFLAADSDGILTGANLIRISVSALRGVILQQVSKHLGAGKIVDGNDFKTFSAKHLTERQTTDTTKAIDCNFNRHGFFPPFVVKNSLLKI